MIINVFTKENCMPCKATKRWLNEHGFKFNELSIPEYADILRESGHLSAPVVSIIFEDGQEETFSGGFNPTRLKELLIESNC